jgi:hypothetical protein
MGRLFHSAQWDHSFDWAAKDVVVIGEIWFCLRLEKMLMIGRKRMQRHTVRPFYE